MLFLGFSAGLPYSLVFSTLSFWLREVGIDRTTIGFLSWVALAYGFKWVWAPLVDRLKLPGLTRWLGRRRSWMLFAQLIIITGLCSLAFSDPRQNLGLFAMLALMVAFASATQDIAIDAYRIESADVKWQGIMAANYMIGYRLAMTISGAGALMIAEWSTLDMVHVSLSGWTLAYLSMALLMVMGVVTVLLIAEPNVKPDEATLEQENKVDQLIDHQNWLPKRIRRLVEWFYDAAVSPFVDFVRRYQWQAILVLALIATYRISDIVLGAIANVFYVDLGFRKSEVALVSNMFGAAMTLTGAFIGGLMVVRLGVMNILLLGGILAAATNLLFAWLASIGHDVTFLTLVISADNLSAGLANAAFIAYLSSLTNISYSATQYALFSSIMMLLPKFLGGFSGAIVDDFGYHYFFLMTASMGIPVLVLIVYAMRYLPLPENHRS
jgi:PAT family beta-lactamase induction signal transducer AmpG